MHHHDPVRHPTHRALPVMTPVARRSRFTLVELLVVVAIIAVLAALLLPALGKAKAEAKRASCLSRLKNVAVAVSFYRDDADDWYPVNDIWNGATPWPDPAPNRYRFGTMIRPYLQPTGFGASAGVSENIFWCPASRYRPGMTSAELATTGYALGGTYGNYWASVHFGYGFQPPATYKQYHPMRHVTGDTSTHIMVGEVGGALAPRFGYVTNGTNECMIFHTNRTNMLMVDGHAGSFQRTGVGTGQIDLKRQGLRWN